MVVLLCCTVFKGSFFSSKEPSKETEPSLMDTDFDYTTPSCKIKFLNIFLKNLNLDKSRVLKCFTDDDIDFCVDDGVDVPIMNFDSDSEDDYNEYNGVDDDLIGGDELGRKMAALTLLENNARMRQVQNNATEV